MSLPNKNSSWPADAGGTFFVRSVQASSLDALSVSVAAVAGSVTAAASSRTLGGGVVRYGEYGRTSIGRVRVKAGALRWPSDLSRVKLTKEHNRDESRGYIAAREDDGELLRVTAKVSDGPEGDDALRDAADHTRDGFSFDLVDVKLEGDWIVDGEVVAIGQVGIPAYDDMRIDQVAASQTRAATSAAQNGRNSMTEQEIARLAELRAKSALTADEQAELEQLAAKESEQGADESSASDQGETGAENGASASGTSSGTGGATASVPAGGGPRPRQSSSTTTRDRSGQLRRFVAALTRGLDPNQGVSVTAALADVTESGADDGVLSQPAWSGELWSGVQHEREFVPLLGHGDLTNFRGEGWRWVTKPEMKDYAGDKAAIPSDPIDTEPSSYEAARMAVGHDLDRKFYDFPDAAFLESYVRAVGESWSVKSDIKAHAWIVSHAVPVTTADGPDVGTDPDLVTAPTLLKAAGKALRKVKRNTRSKGTFVLVADDDFDELMDVSEHDVPAFLQLFDIDPGSFTSSELLTPGSVIAGTKQAATFRELPGSPIRVSAQHIANGGVDEGFFGYWAIEQHHESGIVSVGIDAG